MRTLWTQDDDPMRSKRSMAQGCMLAMLTTLLGGCAVRAPAWKGDVQWPTEQSAKLVAPAMEAGVTLAAAAAIREMIRTNPFPDLFWGCASPEQGLDAAVFTGPTPNLYYVVVDQRFDRCQGPRVRVLDGWYVYAVTPQGEVVAEVPMPSLSSDPSPSPESDTSTPAGPSTAAPVPELVAPSPSVQEPVTPAEPGP